MNKNNDRSNSVKKAFWALISVYVTDLSTALDKLP